MKLKKLIAIAMSMTLICLTFFGCGKGKDEDTKLVVRIGTQEMPNDEGIAKTLKYFEENIDADVELIKFDSGKDVNTALASNSIDFGLVGSCPAALDIANGIDIQVIWIHEVLGSVESLVAREEANISTVGDLKGKTVATPFASTAHFSLLKALESAGLSDKDVTVLDMQTSDIYSAWTNGSIDAAYVWEPTLSQLENKVIIKTSEDMAELGYMTTNVEVVRTEFANEHPDIVSGYIKSLNQAVELNNSDNEKAVSTIAEAMNISSEDAKFQMEGSKWLKSSEQLDEKYLGTSDKKGSMSQNLYDTAVFLKEQGSITDVPDISEFEKAVVPKYIEDQEK